MSCRVCGGGLLLLWTCASARQQGRREQYSFWCMPTLWPGAALQCDAHSSRGHSRKGWRAPQRVGVGGPLGVGGSLYSLLTMPLRREAGPCDFAATLLAHRRFLCAVRCAQLDHQV